MKHLIGTLAATAALAFPAFAQDAAMDPATMTCSDFMALDAAGHHQMLHGARYMAISLNGQRTVVLSENYSLIINDDTGKRLSTLPGHSDRVNSAAFSPDGHFIATASSDRTVRLWSTSNGECLEVFDNHEDEVLLVVFSLDGTVLSSGDRDGVLHIRDITSLVGQLRDRKI